MEITLKIDEERIGDLIVGAIEGGSIYWATFKNASHDGKRYALPFTVIDNEETEPKSYVIDQDTIKHGLQNFAKNEATHFADFLKENDDSTTSDVFLQCCIFEKARYG